MDEIHQAPYSGHPGYQKTISTAKKQYFYPGVKKDIDEHISKCMKCQQVKVENKNPYIILYDGLVFLDHGIYPFLLIHCFYKACRFFFNEVSH